MKGETEGKSSETEETQHLVLGCPKESEFVVEIGELCPIPDGARPITCLALTWPFNLNLLYFAELLSRS